MYDFIIAAFPWIAMSITVAIILANTHNRNKADHQLRKRPTECVWGIFQDVYFTVALFSSFFVKTKS